MKKFLFGGLLALSALAVSCSNDKNDLPDPEGGEASMVVRISGNSTRANPSGGVSEEDILKGENHLQSFTAYVFNYTSGRLEAKAAADPGATIAKITGLNSATQKRVVVTANTDIDIEVGENYSLFKTKMVDLDNEPTTFPVSPTPSTKGFAMYGENSPLKLNEGDNQTTVSLDRLVGKVTLNKITVSIETDPDDEKYLGYDEADLLDFKITGITMQKVIGQAGFLGDNSGVFYGGMTGTGLVSTAQRAYLIDGGMDHVFNNDETVAFGNYYYVMPNDGETGEYTMLTVMAEFKGDKFYYPVIVGRDKDENGKNIGSIENNHHYRIELVIRDLQGSVDPETPKGEAALDVIVRVENWTLVPIQVEEW